MMHSSFFTLDGQAIDDLGEKNRAAAVKWRVMSTEKKQYYQQQAAQLPSTFPSDTSYDKWHETQRVLSNMQDNVSEYALFFMWHNVFV